LGSFHQLEKMVDNLLDWDDLQDYTLELNLYLAQAFLGQSKNQEALSLLQNMRRDIGQGAHPQKCRIYLLLADAFFYSHKVSEAKKVVSIAEELSHDSALNRLDYLYHYFQFLGYERSDNKYVYRFVEQFPIFSRALRKGPWSLKDDLSGHESVHQPELHQGIWPGIRGWPFWKASSKWPRSAIF
jgi:hypothetical protein